MVHSRLTPLYHTETGNSRSANFIHSLRGLVSKLVRDSPYTNHTTGGPHSVVQQRCALLIVQLTIMHSNLWPSRRKAAFATPPPVTMPTSPHPGNSENRQANNCTGAARQAHRRERRGIRVAMSDERQTLPTTHPKNCTSHDSHYGVI